MQNEQLSGFKGFAAGFIGTWVGINIYDAINGKGAFNRLITYFILALILIPAMIWHGIDEVVNVHDIDTNWVAEQVWSIKGTIEYHDGINKKSLSWIEDDLNEIYKRELDQGREPISRNEMLDADMWMTKVDLSAKDANLMADLSSRIYY